MWAPYWYNRVEESTGFNPYLEKEVYLDDELIPMYTRSMEHYNHLFNKRINNE
jgi:hypothetical protein